MKATSFQISKSWDPSFKRIRFNSRKVKGTKEFLENELKNMKIKTAPHYRKRKFQVCRKSTVTLNMSQQRGKKVGRAFKAGAKKMK